MKDYRYDVIDSIDKSLVRSPLTALSSADYSFSATSIGNYALFAGKAYGASDVVDVYSIAEEVLTLTLYKGTKYKFQDMDEEAVITSNIDVIEVSTPVTGYIKFKNTTIS